MDTIRSASNPHVKRVRAALAGREPGFILLEGRRLIEQARELGHSFELLLVAEDQLSTVDSWGGIDFHLVSESIVSRLSQLVTSPGMLALVREPPHRAVDSVPLDEDTLIVIVCGIQNPGNLGSLARSAEAAGASALVVLKGGCSPWNAKSMRGSMGSLLRLPTCVESDPAHVAKVLATKGVRHVKAATRDGTRHDRFDWAGPIALWVSSETGELLDLPAPIQADFENVSIPMAVGVESLNVTAAAAVLFFAAGRTGGALA